MANWTVQSQAIPSLQGSETEHSKIREEVVQHMESHHDEFAPFVEDDEGFDKYMKRMRRVCPRTGVSLFHNRNAHTFLNVSTSGSESMPGAELYLGGAHGGSGDKYVL